MVGGGGWGWSAGTTAWNAKEGSSDLPKRLQEPPGGLGKVLWVLCEGWPRRGKTVVRAKGGVAIVW